MLGEIWLELRGLSDIASGLMIVTMIVLVAYLEIC